MASNDNHSSSSGDSEPEARQAQQCTQLRELQEKLDHIRRRDKERQQRYRDKKCINQMVSKDYHSSSSGGHEPKATQAQQCTLLKELQEKLDHIRRRDKERQQRYQDKKNKEKALAAQGQLQTATEKKSTSSSTKEQAHHPRKTRMRCLCGEEVAAHVNDETECDRCGLPSGEISLEASEKNAKGVIGLRFEGTELVYDMEGYQEVYREAWEELGVCRPSTGPRPSTGSKTQFAQPSRAQVPHSTPIHVYRTFQRLGVGHCLYVDERQPEGNPYRQIYILFAVDYFSRMGWAWRSTRFEGSVGEAEDDAKVLVKHFHFLARSPAEMQSNTGGQFTATVMKYVAQRMGIKLIGDQRGGRALAFGKRIKNLIRAVFAEHCHVGLDEAISRAMFHYNSSPHEALSHSQVPLSPVDVWQGLRRVHMLPDPRIQEESVGENVTTDKPEFNEEVFAGVIRQRQEVFKLALQSNLKAEEKIQRMRKAANKVHAASPPDNIASPDYIKAVAFMIESGMASPLSFFYCLRDLEAGNTAATRECCDWVAQVQTKMKEQLAEEEECYIFLATLIGMLSLCHRDMKLAMGEPPTLGRMSVDRLLTAKVREPLPSAIIGLSAESTRIATSMLTVPLLIGFLKPLVKDTRFAALLTDASTGAPDCVQCDKSTGCRSFWTCAVCHMHVCLECMTGVRIGKLEHRCEVERPSVLGGEESGVETLQLETRNYNQSNLMASVDIPHHAHQTKVGNPPARKFHALRRDL